MSFDHRRLVELCLDIESYLGYLKGNELVAEYVESQNIQGELWAIDHADEQLAAHSAFISFRSSPSDSEFACDFNRLSWLLPFDPQGDRPSWAGGMLETLNEGLKTSWDNGPAWASGISDYLSGICTTFTQAEVDKFKDVAFDLKNALPIGLIPADFASSTNSDFGSTLVHWQGGSRDAFVTFYEHLPPRADLYASLVSVTGDWVEGVGSLVAAAQAGLLEFLQAVKDSLAEQLGQWVEHCGPPSSYSAPSDLGWVADIAGIGVDILEAIPVIDSFTEVPGDIATVAEAFGDLKSAGAIIDNYVNVGGDDLPKRPVEFTVKSAADIYTGLTATLHDDFLGEFDKAVLKLDTERVKLVSDSVANIQGDGDFFTRVVPGIRRDNWQSDDA